MFSAILESKLDSVPELNSVTSPTTATTTITTTASATTAESSPAAPPATPAGAPGAAVEVPAIQDGDTPAAEEEPQVLKRKSASTILSPTHVKVRVKTVAEDERYSKFFKMLKMGVPLQVLSTLSKYFIFEPLSNHTKIMEKMVKRIIPYHTTIDSIIILY